MKDKCDILQCWDALVHAFKENMDEHSPYLQYGKLGSLRSIRGRLLSIRGFEYSSMRRIAEGRG